MTLFELLQTNHNDLTDHDLAVLADWAGDWKNLTPNPDWKRAYALIREGSDLLLRRRARSTCNLDNHIGQPPMQEGKCVDYLSLRRYLNDFESTFYGPHECEHCGVTVVRKAREQGGQGYEQLTDATPEWKQHLCDPNKIEAKPRAAVNTAAPLPTFP